MFDKHRKRRIIFNDDGDQQGLSGNQHYDYHITDETSFLEARTRRVFRTAVDTYVWCVGKGGSPRRAGHRHYVLHPFLDSPDHATELVVQECHANGLEVWGSLRMNDIHDSFRARDLEDTGEAFKAEHPDCMIPAYPVDTPRPFGLIAAVGCRPRAGRAPRMWSAPFPPRC